MSTGVISYCSGSHMNRRQKYFCSLNAFIFTYLSFFQVFSFHFLLIISIHFIRSSNQGLSGVAKQSFSWLFHNDSSMFLVKDI